MDRSSTQPATGTAASERQMASAERSRGARFPKPKCVADRFDNMQRALGKFVSAELDDLRRLGLDRKLYNECRDSLGILSDAIERWKRATESNDQEFVF